MELTLPDLRHGYVELLRRVLLDGQFVTTRGLATHELTAVTLLLDPLSPLLPVGVGRRVNLLLAAVEALTLIAGESRPNLVRHAAPNFTRVLVDPDDLDYGAYGPRLRDQVRHCVGLLSDDPSTRRAVAAIWREADLTHDGDRPCTVFLQFLLRRQTPPVDGDLPWTPDALALELHVHMRSQDVWLGVPYDLFAFSQLQHTVARELRVPAGRYVHHATSLHLYETNHEAATAVVAAYDALPDLQPCDDLPLGVATAHSHTSAFTLAGHLLNEATLDPSPIDPLHPTERDLNAWYLARLAELRRRLE